MPGVDSEALSALHAAIAADDLKSVRKIISSGLDVNDLHFREGWPLSHAVEVGNPKVVEALLKAGADPNRHDGNGESALLVARMDNNKKLLEPVVSSEERAWVNERFSTEYKAAVELDRSIESAIKRRSCRQVQPMSFCLAIGEKMKARTCV